jgi:hypothetical protein
MEPERRIQDLAVEIEALQPRDRLELLRRVLTPEVELRLLIDELSQRARGHDREAITRDVDRTVQEIRRQRREAPTP